MTTRGWTKLSEYQAIWDPDDGNGYFYFTDFRGNRNKTPTVDAAQFSIILDILRNEKPVYGNYKTASVTTQGEGVGEGEI
jgi:hypothetical protein